MTPKQLEAGRGWARGLHRRHPRPRTEREIQAAFDAAEAADERERERRS